MLLSVLALTLAAAPAQRAPRPGTRFPTLMIKRVLWLPATASYTSTEGALSPKLACDGANIGLPAPKGPYLTVKMDDVKAAVKANDLKTATGGSPEGSKENWSPEGALKIAKQFKADYYGMVKITDALRVEIAGVKSVEVRSLVSLYDATGHVVVENEPLRARDKSTNPNAREAAFALGKTVIPDWYKANVPKPK